MDEEVLKKALKADLTANEWKVLAALALGHRNVYDIQRVTGLQKVRVVNAVQNARIVLRTRRLKTTSGTLVPSVQNARLTPTRLLVVHLYTHLGRPMPRDAREYAAAKRMYERAYDGPANKDQDQAVGLVLDCLEVNIEALRRAEMPTLYLQKIFNTYLSALPKIPLDLWEAQQSRRVRFRYNNRSNNWERATCSLKENGQPSESVWPKD